jgi:hypothetical protein
MKRRPRGEEVRDGLGRDARINNVRALERGIKYQDPGRKNKKLRFTTVSAKPEIPSLLKL